MPATQPHSSLNTNRALPTADFIFTGFLRSRHRHLFLFSLPGGPRPRRDIPFKSAVIPPVFVDFIGDTFYSYTLAILILSRFALRVNAPSLLPSFPDLIAAMVSNAVEGLLFVITQIFVPFIYMAGNIKFNHGAWLIAAWLMACGTAFFDFVFYRYGVVNPTPVLLRDLHSFFGVTLALDIAIGLLFTQIVVEEYGFPRCACESTRILRHNAHDKAHTLLSTICSPCSLCSHFFCLRPRCLSHSIIVPFCDVEFLVIAEHAGAV